MQPQNMQVAGDTALQSDVLESLTSLHNYRRWVASLVYPYLGNNPIELGSGHGDYADEWISMGQSRITLTEIDPQRLKYLADRFRQSREVSIRPHVGREHLGSYSSFVAVNV